MTPTITNARAMIERLTVASAVFSQYGSHTTVDLLDDAAACIQSLITAVEQAGREALEDDRVELGVIELQPKAALRDDFYRVADDLRRAGCIVDVWLMDIQTVLKRHGYRMEVYRALITGKDKG